MIKLKSLFRRGQGGSPSSTSSGSSKQPQQQQTNQQISPAHSAGLKTSASASSLDRVAIANAGSASADLGANRKLSKGHKQSSKDKLNDLLRAGSKEKLVDEKKELKKQKKQQMQQVAQQQQQSTIHLPSSSSSSSEQQQQQQQPTSIDIGGFDGAKEVSSFNFLSSSAHSRSKNLRFPKTET